MTPIVKMELGLLDLTLYCKVRYFPNGNKGTYTLHGIRQEFQDEETMQGDWEAAIRHIMRATQELLSEITESEASKHKRSA